MCVYIYFHFVLARNNNNNYLNTKKTWKWNN